MALKGSILDTSPYGVTYPYFMRWKIMRNSILISFVVVFMCVVLSVFGCSGKSDGTVSGDALKGGELTAEKNNGAGTSSDGTPSDSQPATENSEGSDGQEIKVNPVLTGPLAPLTPEKKEPETDASKIKKVEDYEKRKVVENIETAKEKAKQIEGVKVKEFPREGKAGSNTKAKAVLIKLKPGSSQYRYDSEIDLFHITPTENKKLNAKFRQTIRTERNNRVNAQFSNVRLDGGTSVSRSRVQSMLQSSWSASFDDYGYLRNVSATGQKISPAMFWIGLNDAGLGLMNFVTSVDEVQTNSMWSPMIDMQKFLHGWIPERHRVASGKEVFGSLTFLNTEQVDGREIANVTFVIRSDMALKSNVDDNAPVINAKYESSGKIQVEMRTGMPYSITGQATFSILQRGNNESWTAVFKSDRVK